MPDFGKMYVELYNVVNEAMRLLVEGETEEAFYCLLEGQVKTIGQLVESTDEN